MDAIDTEIRRDTELLSDVLRLLGSRAPLAVWQSEAVAALAEALAPKDGGAIERAKAERLERHLFAGPAPEALARLANAIAYAPGRRADRLRADLADLVTFGAGLHLVADPG